MDGGSKAFGGFVKRRRIALGMTLREFCRVNGLDAGNMSKYERGVLSPPQSHQARAQIARALQIEEGTDDWTALFDLADLSAGRIPPDLAADEELTEHLPLLFRTARGEKLSEEELRALIESIRREGVPSDKSSIPKKSRSKGDG